MKHNILYLSLLAAVVLVLSACSIDTDTVAGDGDMEGFWHLETIQTLPTDSTQSTVIRDLRDQRFFWSFQHKLLELRDYDSGNKTMLCRFAIAGGQLTITEAYIESLGNDQQTTDTTLLAPYGITRLNQPYDYRINGSRMTIDVDTTRLYLKRF